MAMTEDMKAYAEGDWGKVVGFMGALVVLTPCCDEIAVPTLDGAECPDCGTPYPTRYCSHFSADEYPTEALALVLAHMDGLPIPTPDHYATARYAASKEASRQRHPSRSRPPL